MFVVWWLIYTRLRSTCQHHLTCHGAIISAEHAPAQSWKAAQPFKCRWSKITQTYKWGQHIHREALPDVNQWFLLGGWSPGRKPRSHSVSALALGSADWHFSQVNQLLEVSVWHQHGQIKLLLFCDSVTKLQKPGGNSVWFRRKWDAWRQSKESAHLPSVGHSRAETQPV